MNNCKGSRKDSFEVVPRFCCIFVLFLQQPPPTIDSEEEELLLNPSKRVKLESETSSVDEAYESKPPTPAMSDTSEELSHEGMVSSQSSVASVDSGVGSHERVAVERKRSIVKEEGVAVIKKEEENEVEEEAQSCVSKDEDRDTEEAENKGVEK